MERSMFKRESKAGKHHFSKDLIYSLKLFVFIMTLDEHFMALPSPWHFWCAEKPSQSYGSVLPALVQQAHGMTPLDHSLGWQPDHARYPHAD